MRVSPDEKETLRKAAAKAAARFESLANPKLLERRPLLRERYLSEWMRRVLLRAAKLEDLGLDGDRRDGESTPDVKEGPSGPEREAAWQALKALANQGWRSEGAPISRDELHDR